MTESTRTVMSVVVIVVVVLVALPLLWGTVMMGGMMGPWMMGGWTSTGVGPWWGLVPMVFFLLVIGGVGFLAAWAVQQTGPRTGIAQQPLDILKQRYARGELTREQYQQMRQELV